MTSDEGLNAYGAATWGQFFLYQGFNDRLGWMHTSTGADAIDEYAETVVRKGGRLFYRYGGEERPLVTKRITVPYRTASGMARRTFTVYRTHHGPIVRAAGGKWISVRLMEKPIEALSQSFLRTKARTLAEYRKVMELHANSSNNTVYADADGHIAYFHPQFVPEAGRPVRLDPARWTAAIRPPSGTACTGSRTARTWSTRPTAGSRTPTTGHTRRLARTAPSGKAFPRYMDAVGESPRGLHAIRVLEGRKDFTLERLRDAAFDSYLTAFAQLVPALLAAYDSTMDADSLKAKLAEPIAALRAWDYRWAASSVPTSLAVYWGEALAELARGRRERGRAGGLRLHGHAVRRRQQKLGALAAAVGRLTRDFGTWRTPWGEINRFQRLTGDIVQPFNDAGPSIPVPFTSARWGSLASFGARTYPGTKRMYGTGGNSFVAVVEFGQGQRAGARR